MPGQGMSGLGMPGPSMQGVQGGTPFPPRPPPAPAPPRMPPPASVSSDSGQTGQASQAPQAPQALRPPPFPLTPSNIPAAASTVPMRPSLAASGSSLPAGLRGIAPSTQTPPAAAVSENASVFPPPGGCSVVPPRNRQAHCMALAPLSAATPKASGQVVPPRPSLVPSQLGRPPMGGSQMMTLPAVPSPTVPLPPTAAPSTAADPTVLPSPAAAFPTAAFDVLAALFEANPFPPVSAELPSLALPGSLPIPTESVQAGVVEPPQDYVLQ